MLLRWDFPCTKVPYANAGTVEPGGVSPAEPVVSK